MVKSLPAMQETWVQSLGQEDPWRREWLPTPVFLPGEFHGHGMHVWTAEPGGLQPMGLQRVEHNENFHFIVRTNFSSFCSPSSLFFIYFFILATLRGM